MSNASNRGTGEGLREALGAPPGGGRAWPLDWTPGARGADRLCGGAQERLRRRAQPFLPHLPAPAGDPEPDPEGLEAGVDAGRGGHGQPLERTGLSQRGSPKWPGGQ